MTTAAGVRARERRDPRVVVVQDRRAVAGSASTSSALASSIASMRSGPLQVDGRDRGHDPDRRPAQGGQGRDLAADVHPHLEDGGPVLRPQAQERERQADLVVLVALAPQGRHRGAQDRGRRVLRGGLGDAARDADDERLEAGPPGRGHGVQAGERVRRPGPRSRRPARRAPPRRAAGRRAAPRRPRRRGGQEAVAVGALAGKGHEEAARRHEAGVHGAAADGPRGAAEERAPRRRDEVVGGEGGRGRGSASSRAAGTVVTAGSVAQAGLTGPRRLGEAEGSAVHGAPGRGVAIASVAIRRNSSNDSTGISMQPVRLTSACPPRCARPRRRPGSAPDEADERVVEDVAFQRRFSPSQIWAVPVLPPTT